MKVEVLLVKLEEMQGLVDWEDMEVEQDNLE